MKREIKQKKLCNLYEKNVPNVRKNWFINSQNEENLFDVVDILNVNILNSLKKKKMP
jgi:hypothetical protein